MFILFIAFHPGQFVPEGFPGNGKYYATSEACGKAADKQAVKPNVSDAKCLAVQVDVPAL